MSADTAEITYIDGTISVAESLRRIADAIDEGLYAGKTATLILDVHVMSLGMGEANDPARTLWDLQVASARIVKKAVEYAES